MVDVDAVFSASLTIAIGLFLIDMVPLQETMVCTEGYHNASTCPDTFFSQSYFAAREKFVSAARNASAELRRHVIASVDGVDYTLDTAFLPGKKSGALLVHISGSDGVGGFTGSAIQAKLLREWNSSRSQGPSVLFVHALNPYGMANLVIGNENNVNLRRNYLLKEEWGKVLSGNGSDTAYDEIVTSLTLPKAPRMVDRYAFFYYLAKMLLKQGSWGFRRVLERGQWHNPDGLFYGGREQQSSVAVLRDVLRTYASVGVERFVVMDLHSESGTAGRETIIADSPEGKALAQSIFQSSVQLRGEDGAYQHIRGLVKPTDVLGKRKGSLVVEEAFATANFPFMLRAAFLERAADKHARGSFVHEAMRQWLRDAYFPQTISYKTSSLSKGVTSFNSAWNYLST